MNRSTQEFLDYLVVGTKVAWRSGDRYTVGTLTRATPTQWVAVDDTYGHEEKFFRKDGKKVGEHYNYLTAADAPEVLRYQVRHAFDSMFPAIERARSEIKGEYGVIEHEDMGKALTKIAAITMLTRDNIAELIARIETQAKADGR